MLSSLWWYNQPYCAST